LFSAPQRFAGAQVATVICGSNLTPEQVRDWLESTAVHSLSNH
jgi:hypothetical protein